MVTFGYFLVHKKGLNSVVGYKIMCTVLDIALAAFVILI